MSKITISPIDLFDVETFDLKRCKKDKPRTATQREVVAYLRWIAGKAGLYPFDDVNLNATYATFGRCESEAKWCNETRSYSIPQYQAGAYSIPMPGRNAHRDMVTMETLDDDGNVIASQSLPVEPKKGGVIWDRDTVRKAAGKVAKPSRGKVTLPTSIVRTIGGQHYQINRGDFGTSVFHNPHDLDGVAQPGVVIGEPIQGRTGEDIEAIIATHLNPPSAEIDDRAENLAAETQEPVAMVDDAREVVALLSEPEIAPAEPSSNPCQLPAPGLADQVAALAAMVEEMRAQLAALQSPPVEGISVTPPVSGKRERTAAHERAIRSYLKMRKDRDHKAKYARLWYLEWQKEHGAAGQAKLKRRSAINRALTLRSKLRRQEDISLERLRHIRDLSDEVVTLKSRPHHMGQEIKPDDYQRLIRERDEARASLASESEKLRVMRTNLERGTDALDMMTERALRAENALRALEQRRERADSPYRVNVGQVNFRAAA